MSIVIQFAHSGMEEEPNRLAKHSRNFLPVSNNPGFSQRNWTVGHDHGRKFLQDKGNYVDVLNGSQHVTNADLCFWCEAEWNTMARSLVQPPNVPATSVYPNWLHCFYSVPPAFTPPFGQNTDPYVFGPQFIYSNCRQNGAALRAVTFQAGDMILFGSMKRDYRCPRFMLDTVLVVESSFAVKPKTSLPNIKVNCGKLITRNFEETVLKPLQQTGGCTKKKRFFGDFTLYFGATYHAPWNGIFSFVPVKVPGLVNIGNGDSGYERLTFTAQNLSSLPGLSQILNLNLNPQFGIHPSPVNASFNTAQIWNEIVQFAKSQGYVLGTYFKEP